MTVSPSVGLVDGQTVTVDASGWSPGALIGYCQGASIAPADPSNCDGGNYSSINADGAGSFSAAVTLKRFVYVPRLAGLVDCAEPSAACVIGAADVADVVNTAALAPITFAPAPATAPTIGVGVAGDGQATVSWTAPKFDGGSAVTGYLVTPYIIYSPQPPQTFTTAATTETVIGLTNGVTYRFAVQAINSVGPGSSSALSKPVTAGTAGSPTIGTAVAGHGQASLSWAAPIVDNGFPVTGYTVTPYIGYSPQLSISFNSTATTQTVTGLTSGATYRFRVQAVNANGAGAYSTASNSVIPTNLTPPDPPMIGTATAGDGQATISWIAPASDGGSQLTAYVVTPYIGYWPGSSRTFNPSDTTQTVTGLTNGSTYRFRVQAINGVGAGGYSKISNPVTPTG
jgi:predicted phage tail protein